MIELSPERLLAVVSERAANRSSTLMTFWLRVMGDRHQYDRAVVSLRGQLAIVPLIVRDGFVNANAIHSDLAALISENREAFEGLSGPFTVSNPLVIVLLARTDLGIPQVSSPAALPEWLPGLGGTAAEVLIENLSTAATAPLNATESRIDEIATGIFDLEAVLLNRLAAVHESDHRCGNGFFEHLKDRGGTDTYAGFLEAARKEHGSVQQASAFRPSAASARSLVGRLMRVVSASSPDTLGSVASALVTALSVDESRASGIPESLPAVLLRPTNRDTSEASRFGRNVLVTLYAASQFITAAAHADAYAGFVVVLLQGMSYNLRQTMRDAAEVISSLPVPAARVIPEQYRQAARARPES